MAADSVNPIVWVRVPRELAHKLDKMAKDKDQLKSWAAEAREILQKAVREYEAADME